MSPQELLRAADTLLIGATPSMARCWQRACAALLRLALEQALRDYWQHRARSVAAAKMRAQLLILPVVAGDGAAAATARRAWNELSRAVHHHTYELPPTAAELRGWHDDVLQLLDHLRSDQQSQPKGAPR
jgi:tRNA U34 5-methylaminomethyl-2-thiouridine-forming methyltransferase MnmC